MAEVKDWKNPDTTKVLPVHKMRTCRCGAQVVVPKPASRRLSCRACSRRVYSGVGILWVDVPVFSVVALIAILAGALAWPYYANADEAERRLTWTASQSEDGRRITIRSPGDAVMERRDEADTRSQSIVFSDETRRFQHDDKGQLISASNGQSEVAFAYDTRGLLTGVAVQDRPVLRYRYDTFERLSGLAVGAFVQRYRYDYLGRLKSIETPAGLVSYLYHRASGTIRRTLPNGVTTTRKLNDSGALVALSHHAADQRLLLGLRYTYRPDGLIATIEERQAGARKLCRFTYDIMDRLVASSCDRGQDAVFAYDEMSNLAAKGSMRLASGTAGILAGHAWGDVASDKRGHVRRLPRSDRSVINYAFNGAGLMVSGAQATYQYSPFGGLYQRGSQHGFDRFLSDPFEETWRPFWQAHSDGTESYFVWDGATPLIEFRQGVPVYRLEDHQSSIRLVLSKDGEIAQRQSYTPYGIPEFETDEIAPGFAGLFWDKEAEIYITPARSYHPGSGRFLQPDPVLRGPGVERFSHNLYSYAAGDPLNYVDRDGADPRLVKDDGPNSAFDLKVDVTTRSGENYPRLTSDHTLTGLLHNIISRRENVVWMSAFVDRLSKWTIPFIPRTEPDQDLDPTGKYREEFIADFTRVEIELMQEAYGVDARFFDLSKEQRNGIRDIAIKNFAKEAVKSGKYLNRNINTQFGSTSMDWFSFTASKPFGIKEHGSQFIYGNGKLVWTELATRLNAKDFPKRGQYFADRDINSLLFIKALRNSDLTPREVVNGQLLSPRLNLQRNTETGPDFKIHIKPGVQNEPLGRNNRGLASDLASHAVAAIERAKSVRNQFDLLTGRQDVAGPGGIEAPGADKAAKLFKSQMAQPSRVGGVYLGGAGSVLDGFDAITGVGFDESSGRVVLLGGAQAYDLPPLRIDDVVTIFRAVYKHGQSPSVTIDPDPKDPKGPLMHVAHGPGTQDTYVGWVLYQADRIMKSYQMGRDNLTDAPIQTTVPGYHRMQKALFFSGTRAGSEPVWERFWIVPDRVDRVDALRQASLRTSASLFRVPLRVNTQKMRWRNGQLEDDTGGSSSPGARAFSQWFSANYGAIADEVSLTPPHETGIKGPVHVYHELSRIAAITAVAERLRDIGVAMPLWMRDHDVTLIPIDQRTPSLTIRKTDHTGSAQVTSVIFGGVNLAPADRDVHVYSAEDQTSVLQAADAAPELRDFLQLSQQRSKQLVVELSELAQAPLKNGPFVTANLTNSDILASDAAIFAGPETRAGGANRLSRTDVSLPMGRGAFLTLTRHYNSFFDPIGSLGVGWSLDLPELEFFKKPVSRDGFRSKFIQVPNLGSPLGSVSAFFSRRQVVQPYGVPLLVDPNTAEIDGFARLNSKMLGHATGQVMFADGTIWHFSDHGKLLMAVRAGIAKRYIWDRAGRLEKVIGLLGNQITAEMRLSYDAQDRLVRVTGHGTDPASGKRGDTREVHYAYTEAGRLERVEPMDEVETGGCSTTNEYAHNVGLLVAEEECEQPLAQYAYSDDRSLREAKVKDAVTRVERTQADGQRISTILPNGETLALVYDAKMRPVSHHIGSQNISMRHGSGGVVQADIRNARGEIESTIEGDAQKMVLRSKNGALWTEYQEDAKGGINVLLNGQPAYNLGRVVNGQLANVRTQDSQVSAQYDTFGLQSGVMISAPLAGNSTTEWITERWDPLGRPFEISDASGWSLKLGYDAKGRMSGWSKSGTMGGGQAARIKYDAQDRVSEIHGQDQKFDVEYYSDSGPKEIRLAVNGANAVMEFDARGRPQFAENANGARTRWSYSKNTQRIELANGLVVKQENETPGLATRIRVEGRESKVEVHQGERQNETFYSWIETIR